LSPTAPPILASASPTRANLLRGAGINCDIFPAHIDETAVKRALRTDDKDGALTAAALAEQKALAIAGQYPARLVIGADQVLVCDGMLYDKPANRDEAHRQLRTLRGREHELVSGVCAAENGVSLWRHIDRARLTMRAFSDGFLEHYLDEIGDAAVSGPGAYQIEGLGAQLFAEIDGDYFTILGLPLLPLLTFLRGKGMVGT